MLTNPEDFHTAVHQIISTVPVRTVITCGHIAKLLGVPTRARQVRQAVKFIMHTTPPVPWHRVVASSGVLSAQGGVQQRLLEAEGVEVCVGVVGERRVRLDVWGWFPQSVTIQCPRSMRDVQGDVEWGA